MEESKEEDKKNFRKRGQQEGETRDKKSSQAKWGDGGSREILSE